MPYDYCCATCKANPMFKLVKGALAPPGYEPINSWQDGTEAAKSLGFSGDSAAYGSYTATDCNFLPGKRPKGMFRDPNNTRFLFNCGEGGNCDCGDMLVKRTEEPTPLPTVSPTEPTPSPTVSPTAGCDAVANCYSTHDKVTCLSSADT